MWRAALAALMLLALPTGAMAQGTVIPAVDIQFFDNSGNPCASCELNAYAGGTTTRQNTYSDVTLVTANANPVILDANGRAVIYLSATTYRFVLTNSGGGTTYWDRDNITSIPTTSGNVDITGTAGAAIAANDVVYLSDGSGALTAGRWYPADADNTYSSTTAFLVGIAPSAIASAASGTIRLVGRVTGLSSLTAGELYYAGATAGALTATPPTNARFIGKADSTTTLVIGGGSGGVNLPDSDGTHTLSFLTTSNLAADRRITINPGDSNRQITLSTDLVVDQGVATTDAVTFTTVNTGQGANELYDMDQNVLTTSAPSFNQFRPPQGRCTLTSATPVTTTDVTAATTLYYALYGGNQITLYDGSARWVQTSFTELSIAVPATTATMYDVFVDYSAGPALEVVAWTNDTTRATALALQNGVYVQTSDTDSLYVCSFRTTGVSGQTEDSLAKRLVFNYYNRVDRPMRVLEATNNWTYTTATWRQANGATANQLEFVIGVDEDPVTAWILATSANDNANVTRFVAFGLDSTTTPITNGLANSNAQQSGQPATQRAVHVAFTRQFAGVGRHTLVWLEISTATGTTTWDGDSGNTDGRSQNGIEGVIQG